MAPHRQSRHQGFTLIEVVVYLAIFVLVATPATAITMTFIRNLAIVQRRLDVGYAGTSVIERMFSYGRAARSVETGTQYGAYPGTLVVRQASGENVTIDTYAKAIAVGDASVLIRKLRAHVGTAPPVDLTPDTVDVRSFVLTNRSLDATAAIAVHLEIDALNATGSLFYAAPRTWDTTITLR